MIKQFYVILLLFRTENSVFGAKFDVKLRFKNQSSCKKMRFLYRRGTSIFFCSLNNSLESIKSLIFYYEQLLGPNGQMAQINK